MFNNRQEVAMRSLTKGVLVVICAAALVYAVSSCSQKMAPTALEPSKTQQAQLMSGQVFVAYDVPPTPEGGFKAIFEKIVYPESARKAGIEGRAILKVLVKADGSIGEVEVVRSAGNADLDKAAVDAIRAVTWKAAVANNRPVEVAVHVPVVFRLGESRSQEGRAASDGAPGKEPTAYDFGFVQYDRPPEPIGGFTAIQRNLRFPETARGITGRSILNILIDKDGQVVDMKVIKSAGHPDLDTAAMKAVRSVQWKPATKKGEPVDVWVAIPVIFK
jgi:TonB family protein